MAKKNPLKPCFRCGAEACFSITTNEYLVEKYYQPGCTECEMVGVGSEYKDEAIEWWNKRPEKDLEDVVTESLEKMILNIPTGKYRNQLCDINIQWLNYLQN